MRTLIKEVHAPEFKDYIAKMKSCRPGASYEIESKYGHIAFKFDKYAPSFISLNIRRKNGNGIGLAITGKKSIDFKVSSQRYETITFPIGDDYTIDIRRSQRSTGSIELLSFSIYSDSDKIKTNWYDILKNCETSGINVIGDKLMAYEGAVIKTGKIKELIVNPPGLVTNLGNEAVFLGPCEIKVLDVESNVQKTGFKHLEAEPNVLVPEKRENKPSVTYSKIEIKTKTPHIQDPGFNRLVYDSSVHGFQKYSFSGNVTIDRDYIILDHDAEYRIPLKFIYPNLDYIVIVEGHSVSGNGKITLTIDTALNDINQPIILSPNKKSINKKIKLSSNLDGSNLIIGRSSSGKGKILISKILLILDIDKTVKIPARVFNRVENVNHGFEDLVVDNVDDIILQTSLSFSRHVSNHKFKNTYSLKGSLFIETFVGMSWFSKIQPLLPNFNIDNNAKLAFISSKTLKKPYENVFVEEFLEDKINAGILAILQKSKIIFTPSERNAEYLHNETGVQVEILTKPWPFAIPEPIKFIKDKFILLLNRNNLITDKVLPSLEKTGLKVVLAGARGKYSDFVIPVNEYLNYNSFCWLLANAECVVDIPPINDYKSGVLNLVNAMNVPIVTSNWFYYDAENTKFLNSTEKLNNYKIPNDKIIVESVNELLSSNIKKNIFDSNYNNTVVEEFSKFLS